MQGRAPGGGAPPFQEDWPESLCVFAPLRESIWLFGARGGVFEGPWPLEFGLTRRCEAREERLLGFGLGVIPGSWLLRPSDPWKAHAGINAAALLLVFVEHDAVAFGGHAGEDAV